MEFKVKNLYHKLNQMFHAKQITSKELASLAGTLSAMHHAVGPLVRLQTRATYAAIAKAPSWYARIFLDATTLAEIAFWRDNYNFTSKMLFTDASEDGYGGFLVKRGGHAVVAGKFGALDLATHRELATVKYALQSLESVLINESINIFTDNFSAGGELHRRLLQ